MTATDAPFHKDSNTFSTNDFDLWVLMDRAGLTVKKNQPVGSGIVRFCLEAGRYSGYALEGKRLGDHRRDC